MGIFDIDSGADNHLLNEQFHVFSKSPASVATALGDATNKSGHTVAASDVWAQKIPAFFYAKTAPAAEAFKPLAKVNDLCRIGNSISIFDGTNWVHTYDTYGDIPDGYVFKNADGEGVVRFHKNRIAHLLTLDNNANDNGAGTTAKIQGWDVTAGEIDPETGKPTGAPYPYVETAPKFVSQFVTSTDNIVDGVPSKGYGPIVMVGTTTGDVTKALVEGTSSADHYIANSFAGIIQYNKTRANDTVYVHAFEYCGKSVTDVATGLQAAIDNLGEIAESTGIKDVIAGDGIEVVKEGDGATALTPIIKVRDTIATKTYADTAASGAVADALEEGGSIAEAIATAKSEATADAKVTITPGDGISITGESPGATFEIAVADTIATKTYAEEKAAAAQTAAAADATAKANAAQTDAEATATAALSAARTEITGEISAAKKEATDYTDTEVKKVSDNLAATDKKHGEDIATVKAAIEALTTSGLTREVVSALPTTGIKLNTIYLVQDANAEAGTYIEYLYVGELGEGGTGSVENFEPIGSTKTDLSGYVTTEALGTTLEGYTTDAEHTKLADKVTALETLTGQHTTNITAAQKAADDAQDEVDALEGVVAELTTTVGNNKTATDAAIATKADQTALDVTNTTVAGHTTAIETLNGTTIPAITTRLDAIEAIPTVEVVAAEGTDGAPNYVTVSSSTTDGKTTFTVASTGALETRLDTLESFVGGSGTPGQGLSELLAKKVDNVTGSSYGIAISTADTEAGRVATLTVTPGSVATDNTSVVTGGAVAAAISSTAESTLESAEDYTDEQITVLKTALNAGDVTATNTSITVTQTEGKITAVTVAKGAISDGDTDLIDGGTVFAATNALDTRLAAVEQVATDLDTTIEAAIGELDVASHGSNGITFEQTNGKGAISVNADSKVTADSANVVTSGAVATAISEAIAASEEKAAETYAVKGTETVAENAAAAAKAADDKAVAAQGEVDALEVVVSTLSLTQASDKAALEASIKAVSDKVGTTDVAGQITAAIEALDATPNGNGITVTQVDGVITAVAAADGEVAENNKNVVTGGVVYTAIKTVSDLVGTTAVATQISDAIAALDVAEHGSNGIKLTQTDGKVNLAVTPGSVAENNTSVVTGGAVYTAVEAVKTIAEAKISAVQNDSTHFGSPLVTTAGTTVTVSPAKEWSVGTTKPASTITSVINGKMSDGKTIDDANLTDGASMFANNTALTTYVGDLGKLTTGTSMFSGCTALTTFCANLGSLKKGSGMFNGCPLSVESFMYIVDSLPTTTDTSSNVLGITVVPLEGEDSALIPTLTEELVAKGWALV